METRTASIHPTIVFIVLVSLVAPSALFQSKNLPMWLMCVMVSTMAITFVWTKLVLRHIEIRYGSYCPSRSVRIALMQQVQQLEMMLRKEIK